MTTNQIEQFPDHIRATNGNRLIGIWRLMAGFRLPYFAANSSLALSAFFKASTYFLLRYFVDHVLGTPQFSNRLPLIALGFVLFAGAEGTFTYISGRLAAFTAEGVVRRLRNYLFDHIQRLTFAYHAKPKLEI